MKTLEVMKNLTLCDMYAMLITKNSIVVLKHQVYFINMLFPVSIVQSNSFSFLVFYGTLNRKTARMNLLSLIFRALNLNIHYL